MLTVFEESVNELLYLGRGKIIYNSISFVLEG